MESIKDKVAIIGMGCTKFGELWEKSFYDLVVDSCYEAYEDAGIKPEQVQAAWIGTGYGYHRGLCHSNRCPAQCCLCRGCRSI